MDNTTMKMMRELVNYSKSEIQVPRFLLIGIQT